jgi:hypothetical protein
MTIAAAGLLALSVTLARAIDPPVAPDPKLTPGEALNVDKATVCAPGYAKRARNVSGSLKRAVYREYGIADARRKSVEVDHFIPIELGGANTLKNLWAEPWHLNVAGLDEGAKSKDRLENRLHVLTCSDKLDLKAAQQAITADWIAAYVKFVGPLPKAAP